MVCFTSCYFVILRLSWYINDWGYLHYAGFNKACAFLIKRKVSCYKLPAVKDFSIVQFAASGELFI